MNLLEAFFLGIIQGLTEFLPVSSSGHLVLFQSIFGVQGDMLFFDTMLHFATLAAVFVVFWQEVKNLICHPIQKTMGMLIVATIPAGLAGLFFKDFFEGAFEGQYLAYGFLITALLLAFTEWYASKKKEKRKEPTYGNAGMMGLFQAIAIMPAISRSGATISGGLLTGLERNKAAQFSFLMSIPIILCSILLQGYELVKGGVGEIAILPTIVGMIAAGVSGYFAIRFMLNIIRRKKLYGFAIYVGALGLLVLLDQLVFHIVF